MIRGYHPIVQAVLGTLFTWGLTAAGSALVFVFKSGQRKILDGSLGFAAGVMTAASYWSLLAPAIEMAEQSGIYGENGEWSFVPVALGFILGAAFVYGTDVALPYLGIVDSGNVTQILTANGEKIEKDDSSSVDLDSELGLDNSDTSYMNSSSNSSKESMRRRVAGGTESRRSRSSSQDENDSSFQNILKKNRVNWKRILLLIIAITVHNVPEGLAVGVGFGAIGKSSSATFENARNLAIGIGIQNFPEGLAVSLPLRGSGFSIWRCFWYGQLSGMVEPIAGLLGAFAVTLAEPLLPYALAFAAGAMIYVVCDDIIPEAHTCGNGKLASLGCIIGFVVMMSLDVGLG